MISDSENVDTEFLAKHDAVKKTVYDQLVTKKNCYWYQVLVD